MKTTTLFSLLLVALAIFSFQPLHSQIYWDLSGNSISSGNFLGTTNSNPIEFRTNSNPWLWLETNGGLTLNSGLGNTSARPPLNTGTNTGEFRGQSQWGPLPDDGFLRLSAGGGTNWGTKSWIDLSGYSAVPDMDRNIIFGTQGTERMRIDVAGGVNINMTTSPYQLGVNGPIGAVNGATYGSGLVHITSLSANAQFFNTSFASDVLYLQAGAVGTSVLPHMSLVAGGYERIRIQNNGYVGIGTSTPSFKLDVDGDINIPYGQGLRTGGSMFLREKAGSALLGRDAGLSLTSGGRNTFMGMYSGYDFQTGSYNIGLGYGAGSAQGTTADGDYNTFVGAGAFFTAAAGSHFNSALGAIAGVSNISTIQYATALGAGALVTTSNTVVLGAVNNSQITSQATVVIGNTATTSPAGIPVGGGSAFYGPYILEGNGDAYFSNVYTASDKRFKKSITDFSNATDLIRQLRPVTYEYRDDLYFTQAKGDQSAPVKMNFSKGKQIGFLAQDLEEIIPEMVITRGDGYKNVNYNQLFGVIVQGIKEQDAEITSLKEENQKMIAVIDELKNRLDALERGTVKPVITTSGNDASSTVQPRLEQNNPNPFNETTTVKYFIPQGCGQARIVIRSVNTAFETMSFNITEKGNGHVVVSANSLPAGSYSCELYIDGKLADTKKMILVK